MCANIMLDSVVLFWVCPLRSISRLKSPLKITWAAEFSVVSLMWFFKSLISSVSLYGVLTCICGIL